MSICHDLSVTSVLLSKIQVGCVTIGPLSLFLPFLFFIKDLLGTAVSAGSHLALITWLSPESFVAFVYNVLCIDEELR